jgi:hypothetical protein
VSKSAKSRSSSTVKASDRKPVASYDRSKSRSEAAAGETAEGNPLFVAVLTVGASSMAAVNEFTNAFQFEPFWVDFGFAAAVLGIALYFLGSMFAFESTSPASRNVGRLGFRFAPLRFAAAMVLILIFAVSIGRPVHNALAGDWTVCGTFVSICGKNSCVRLWDEKGRKTTDECLSLDDSGYLPPHAEAWWRYQPAKVSLVCGADERQPVPVNETMLRNAECSGRQELR